MPIIRRWAVLTVRPILLTDRSTESTAEHTDPPGEMNTETGAQLRKRPQERRKLLLSV